MTGAVPAVPPGDEPVTTPALGRYEAREPRVPRTIGAISDALRAGRRARFFAELLDARRGRELDGVLSVWWGRAMRDTAPGPGGLPAPVESAALPGRIVRALPARSTRPKGPRGVNGSRREEGPPEADGRGKVSITVTVDLWLGAHAEELVEAGHASSVSAVVNEALSERFRRERHTPRDRDRDRDHDRGRDRDRGPDRDHGRDRDRDRGCDTARSSSSADRFEELPAVTVGILAVEPQAEHALVEGAQSGLASGRAGRLDMVDHRDPLAMP
ncbi:hypothetical protein ACLQ2R_21730 [Streptosporangium sp. DT93]|uniref:hypothetical protein n=1 Tax=Streptosporangium sp. DT93 TaxID=3393428 RepID=UPI003CEC9F5A